jgi:hypothetical protein
MMGGDDANHVQVAYAEDQAAPSWAARRWRWNWS